MLKFRMANANKPHEVRQDDADPRVRCFESPGDSEAFDRSVTALLGMLQERTRQTFVSEHNVLRMNHGSNWVHTARDPEPDTTMHSISAEWTIPFKDIAENDLGLIGRTIFPISDEMEKQFAQNMYGVVGAAAQKVGNVVDATPAGSFAKSMLEMFRKLELGVDREGNVSMPQMHVGPELYARLPEEMSKVPPELSAEIERVKAEKIQAALDREAERRGRFKRVAG
jgi:hypothetical protein